MVVDMVEGVISNTLVLFIIILVSYQQYLSHYSVVNIYIDQWGQAII